MTFKNYLRTVLTIKLHSNPSSSKNEVLKRNFNALGRRRWECYYFQFSPDLTISASQCQTITRQFHLESVIFCRNTKRNLIINAACALNQNSSSLLRILLLRILKLNRMDFLSSAHVFFGGWGGGGGVIFSKLCIGPSIKMTPNFPTNHR